LPLARKLGPAGAAFARPDGLRNPHGLGSDFILSTGRELRLNPDLVQVDAWEFEEAIRASQWAAAVERYKGTLLEGFHFTDSREFESWIESERARLRREYQTAVEFLANAAAEAGDHSRSVTWWRRLANSDPLSAGATKKLMLALSAAGDRAGAVKHARLYQELVRQELEIEPDSEIESLAASFGHPPIAETTVSGVHEKASHDRLTSTEDSAQVPLNRSSALPGTEGMTTPCFSPDGKQVGFLEDRGVRIASIDGGQVITVSDTLNGEAGGSWGPDGFIYVGGIGEGIGDGALLRVRAKAGS